MTNVAQSKTARTRRRPTKKKAAPTQPSPSSSEGEEDLEQTQPSSITASWSASKQTPARRGGRGGAGSKRTAGKYDNSKKQKKKLARHASTDYSPRSQLKAAKRVSKESYPGMNVDYDQKQLPFLPILGLDDDKVLL